MGEGTSNEGSFDGYFEGTLGLHGFKLPKGQLRKSINHRPVLLALRPRCIVSQRKVMARFLEKESITTVILKF